MLRVSPLDLKGSQFEIYRRIAPHHEYAFLFESLTGPEELAETSIIGFDPDAVVRGYADRLEITERGARTRTVRTDSPLDALREEVGAAGSPGEGGYRYVGGAVGIVEYEAAGLWEPRAASVGEAPVMEFGMYSDGILFDSRDRRPYYFCYGRDRSSEIPGADAPAEPFSHAGAVPRTGEAEFASIVGRAKEHVEAGDVFQVVLSRRFDFEYSGDPMRVYERLRELNPSPYLYHMKMGGRSAVGASPEMLLRVTGRTLETFPIAGTRGITGDASEDARRGREMASDEKEIAEHVMLVDLGRNDVGRVCEPGSVRVGGLMDVKRFSHVQHMVTHVSGTLERGRDAFDAFCALFPAGTVTGAPKVRAMEVIAELERSRRGAYAGAVGYFSRNGCCDFAIAIRGASFDGSRGSVQAGAGIVADSVARSEFAETEHKARSTLAALGEASRP